MAINPLIPLSGETVDAGLFQNALLKGQAGQRAQAEEARRAEREPLANRLIELRTQAQELGIEDAKRSQNITDILQAAEIAKELLPRNIEQRGVMAVEINRVMQEAGIDDIITDDDLTNEALEGVISTGEALRKSLRAREGTSTGQRQFESLIAGFSPEDQEKSKRIEAGLDPRAVGVGPKIVEIGGVNYLSRPDDPELIELKSPSGEAVTAESTAESEAGIKEEVAAGAKIGATKEARRAERIIFGAESAEGLPTLRRGIQLLQRVQTGGPKAVSLRVKQQLGIETADEGELANILAKSVLTQYRKVFGAAFTENEGSKLDRIEQGFGKNTATNIRLLEKAEALGQRFADQAIKDAVEIEDFATAAAIKEAMSFEFAEDGDIFGAAESPQEGQTATNPQTNQTIIFRNGQWQPM